VIEINCTWQRNLEVQVYGAGPEWHHCPEWWDYRWGKGKALNTEQAIEYFDRNRRYALLCVSTRRKSSDRDTMYL